MGQVKIVFEIFLNINLNDNLESLKNDAAEILKSTSIEPCVFDSENNRIYTNEQLKSLKEE